MRLRHITPKIAIFRAPAVASAFNSRNTDARVQRAGSCALAGLECFVRIEKDRDRPSFTSSTTSSPENSSGGRSRQACEAFANSSYSALATSGARRDEVGLRCRARHHKSVNCETTSALPFSPARTFLPARLRRCAGSRHFSPSMGTEEYLRADAQQNHQPGADFTCHAPFHRHLRRLTLCRTARMQIFRYSLRSAFAPTGSKHFSASLRYLFSFMFLDAAATATS